ncbi:hypothetical protein MRQ36_00135 [Micromonospora sp. R77]|uniref:hypothetical protein n=1 Tax=Micromonospora sp. R77 TaxID=2925836 RepID=UPI001F6220EF|nr:hypothetical protein [Micromonospora sp. R77]MCI4061059.1 hypothetical protein [Micromonospora sp. R77]
MDVERIDGVVLPELDGSARSGALPRTLGLVSLALGAGALLAPDLVARWTGLDDSREARALLPAIGLRELAPAAGLLRGGTPAGGRGAGSAGTRWTWRCSGGPGPTGPATDAVGSP